MYYWSTSALYCVGACGGLKRAPQCTIRIPRIAVLPYLPYNPQAHFNQFLIVQQNKVTPLQVDSLAIRLLLVSLDC